MAPGAGSSIFAGCQPVACTAGCHRGGRNPIHGECGKQRVKGFGGTDPAGVFVVGMSCLVSVPVVAIQ